jgi:hypothetical protein
LLAKAVAVEHMKLLKAELNPPAPPALGKVVAAQLAQELLCGPLVDDDDEEMGTGRGDGDAGEGPQPPRKARKLTTADRNRQLRARELQEQEERARALKAQRRDVENLAVRSALGEWRSMRQMCAQR